MENQMISDISELKVNQALLLHRQDQADIVIRDLKRTLQTITKGGYIFLGIYIANTLGIDKALGLMLKAVSGI